ncbi:hypothetical protein CNAG_07395 [Cryptococcus neoformans var. grubii H99]|uniref:Uncharacterized protein n=1 Tax=Cryptococcus neoformans (strain H99 / ATCC 208821 / CBS 10515 / FGSC 9487) TaxID=235443 RepID=J9VSB7_CRYN9|nr:hypothetical protein CNAG_07395 [Cryptococcus neoformans var. grubii H99]AFR94600.1 hypothetical protein CNAG_07395 [Cryptococcus neoformans var. grubii H99]AUB24281.1 hypothetical protein CKF44_07395 [Cryptococcus neoformans var. grubii]|eukprot:XP_012049623.1 hypothetical protein CNAG_07395 [Cryptococcus neoformans var. grubii H99]
MRSWVVYSAHWGDNWCGWWHLSPGKASRDVSRRDDLRPTFGCVWMRRQGGGMVHGGGQGGGCWRYSTLYRLRKGKDNRVRKDVKRADSVESRMVRGSVYGWLIFNVHPRLHPTRLHPTPHAPFEFAFLTSDSTLDTRLSLNARRICSATPQHRYSSTSSSHPTRSLSLGYPSTLAQLHDR